MELRYRPVVAAVPHAADRICEIGSGPVGIAAWTPLRVVGVEPEVDVSVHRPANLELIQADGSQIPLEDESFPAVVAVDVLEHVSPTTRATIVREMIRITRPRGRVILMGPTGRAAAEGDEKVLARLRAKGASGGSERWFSEHAANGLPTRDELAALLRHSRVTSVTSQGFFNMSLWYVMHLAALGVIPRTGPLHPFVWAPFAAVATRAHLGNCYRQLVIADIAP
jgi:SAM-dependent methyltransferase